YSPNKWLELQARFAGGIGQRLHAAVIFETRSIERDGFDARRFRLFGDLLADGRSRGDVAGAFQAAAQVLRERRGARDPAIALGRDDLRVDVLRRAMHAQPVNALQGDPHSGAARPTLSIGLFVDRHDYFFFASLSSMRSFE